MTGHRRNVFNGSLHDEVHMYFATEFRQKKNKNKNKNQKKKNVYSRKLFTNDSTSVFRIARSTTKFPKSKDYLFIKD